MTNTFISILFQSAAHGVHGPHGQTAQLHAEEAHNSGQDLSRRPQLMGAAARENLLNPRPAEQVNAKVLVIRSTVSGVPGANGARVHAEGTHKLDQGSSSRPSRMGDLPVMDNRLSQEHAISILTIVMFLFALCMQKKYSNSSIFVF